MSTFATPLTKIKEILPHTNADRLELAKVYDWTVIVGKGQYKPGDVVVYVPVDSILPWDLEQHLFPPTSKIKLNKSRIRSARIRGIVSQGLLIDPKDCPGLNPDEFSDSMIGSDDGYHCLEDDMSEILGIKKYEPPAADVPRHMQAKKKRAVNKNFHKYTEIENFKYYDRMFQDNEIVHISEKLHGTSFRAGWFKNDPNTWWKKIKKFFGLLPEWEFCWGSKNVQIQNKLYHKGYYEVDVYTKIVKQYSLKDRLPKGYAVYGEIVGDGIQKGYTYGCKPGEHKLYVYDIQKDGKYVGYASGEFQHAMFIFNHPFEGVKFLPTLETVPELYVGPFKREILDQHRDGDSLVGGQKIREGVVVKAVEETECSLGRKILKYISEAYYLRSAEDEGTDFH